MTRFVTAAGSITEAIDQVVDLANQAAMGAYNSQATDDRTITTAQMINGVILQTGTPSTVALTTPTAAAIFAAVENAQAGSMFDFVFMNTGDGTVTVTAGDGVTLVGTVAIPANKTQLFKCIVVSSTAVTLIGLLYAPV